MAVVRRTYEALCEQLTREARPSPGQEEAFLGGPSRLSCGEGTHCQGKTFTCFSLKGTFYLRYSKIQGLNDSISVPVDSK